MNLFDNIVVATSASEQSLSALRKRLAEQTCRAQSGVADFLGADGWFRASTAAACRRVTGAGTR